jgi:hypothetical protein
MTGVSSGFGSSSPANYSSAVPVSPAPSPKQARSETSRRVVLALLLFGPFVRRMSDSADCGGCARCEGPLEFLIAQPFTTKFDPWENARPCLDRPSYWCAHQLHRGPDLRPVRRGPCCSSQQTRCNNLRPFDWPASARERRSGSHDPTVQNRIPAADAHAVTGIDVSQAQIERARQLVPSATFLNTDATRPAFGSSLPFDAVVCGYRLIHLTRGERRRAWRNESPNRSGIEKHGSPSRT